MVQYWSLNTCKKDKQRCHKIELGLEDYMLSENVACFGIGQPEEKREEKKGFNTCKQFEKFKNEAEKGDIIYLYSNRVGIIAYAYYNGHLTEELNNKGPWKLLMERQINIGIKEWIKIEPVKPDRHCLCTLGKSKFILPEWRSVKIIKE